MRLIGRLAGAAAASPDVDRIETWKDGQSVWAVRGALHAEIPRFDLVLDLQSNLKTRLLSLIMSAAEKRRYRKPYLHRILLVYLKKNRYPEKKKVADRYFETLAGIDDNPRSENPQAIRAAILQAARGADEIGDRAEAIRAGIAALEPGDALLVAGKGHEVGQIVGDKTLPFSDHEAVAAALAARMA